MLKLMEKSYFDAYFQKGFRKLLLSKVTNEIITEISSGIWIQQKNLRPYRYVNK